MPKVITTKGPIERESLEVKDVIFEEENARVTATEWYLDGKLVRRDVWVNALMPLDLAGGQENLNG